LKKLLCRFECIKDTQTLNVVTLTLKDKSPFGQSVDDSYKVTSNPRISMEKIAKSLNINNSVYRRLIAES